MGRKHKNKLSSMAKYGWVQGFGGLDGQRRGCAQAHRCMQAHCVLMHSRGQFSRALEEA